MPFIRERRKRLKPRWLLTIVALIKIILITGLLYVSVIHLRASQTVKDIDWSGAWKAE